MCWTRRTSEKGSFENPVSLIKRSFTKQRRFHDREDLQTQLRQWLDELNQERPSRATGETPEKRRQQELPPSRGLRVSPGRLMALRIPIQVGVTAEVNYDGRSYAMPPEATGLAATQSLPGPRTSSPGATKCSILILNRHGRWRASPRTEPRTPAEIGDITETVGFSADQTAEFPSASHARQHLVRTGAEQGPGPDAASAKINPAHSHSLAPPSA